MIKIYDNSNPPNIVGLLENAKDALECISDFLKSVNFKSYYIRINSIEDSKVIIDYGSHTHFFYLEDLEGGDIYKELVG